MQLILLEFHVRNFLLIRETHTHADRVEIPDEPKVVESEVFSRGIIGINLCLFFHAYEFVIPHKEYQILTVVPLLVYLEVKVLRNLSLILNALNTGLKLIFILLDAGHQVEVDIRMETVGM